MSKMTMPTIVVVRFQESDVICASSIRTLSISKLGDGVENNGEFIFNGHTYYTGDINGNPDSFTEQMNAYLGTNNLNPYDFYVNPWENIGSLVDHDYVNKDGSTSNDSEYNGTFRWNGTAFVKQ